MLAKTNRVLAVASVVGAMMVMGCSQESWVLNGEFGVKRTLSCVQCPPTSADGICWAVGDNSEAFRSAICAPNPGVLTKWCLAFTEDHANPRAVFVEHLAGASDYWVYQMEWLSVDVSDEVVRGRGKARILRVDLDGNVLAATAESQPASPRQAELSFVLHRRQEKCSQEMQATLDQLRSVAMRFLIGRTE